MCISCLRMLFLLCLCSHCQITKDEKSIWECFLFSFSLSFFTYLQHLSNFHHHHHLRCRFMFLFLAFKNNIHMYVQQLDYTYNIVWTVKLLNDSFFSAWNFSSRLSQFVVVVCHLHNFPSDFSSLCQYFHWKIFENIYFLALTLMPHWFSSSYK